jgi:hypothetical protein
MAASTACLVLMGRLPNRGGQWAPTILSAMAPRLMQIAVRYRF